MIGLRVVVVLFALVVVAAVAACGGYVLSLAILAPQRRVGWGCNEK